MSEVFGADGAAPTAAIHRDGLESQLVGPLVVAGDADGGLSTTDDDDGRKMSQDSLISGSPRVSPLLRPSARRYHDSDSCPSVSPSPDPDSRLNTFDFGAADVADEGDGISAALQTEREFLDFMLSLPQVQKEGPGRPPGEPTNQEAQEETPPPRSEHRSPTRTPAGGGGVVATKVGLDHLDNLCRMMEQLGELREQNTRLQRRVHYLEELQTLQEMHRHLQETLEARRSGLGLGPIHLSDSDIPLDEDGDGVGVDVSRHESEESLVLLHHRPPHKDQFLELPESPVRRHSSSEDDRRPISLEGGDRRDKEKKGHRSAWGKVKNMISTRRDSVRKKSSSSSHRKSTSDRPSDVQTTAAGDATAASDPEDYDVDYDGLVVGEMEPGGVVVMEGVVDQDWDVSGGVWAGPDDSPASTTSLGARRSKPQLTITVPSSENLSLLQDPSGRSRHPQRSPEPRLRKFTPTQLDPRTPLSLAMTPPSPRRASNWTKVKKAFLTGQQVKQEGGGLGCSAGSGGSASLPPSPHKKSSFHFDGVDGIILEDSDSAGASLEMSPDELSVPSISTATPSPQPHPTPSPQPLSLQQSGVQRNLADLQKSLSGEFNRRLQEWERLKAGGGVGGVGTGPPLTVLAAPSSPPASGGSHPEDNLPYEFRKKLYEWEKMKEREKEKVKGPDVPRVLGGDDVKTRIHGEDDLPADFKKKLTEWKIRKALVGKSQQNVEELQKNLGEEFNRKLAEWERIKASASQQGHVKTGHPQVKSSASAGNLGLKTSTSGGQLPVKPSSSTSQVVSGAPASPRLDRKGSAQKLKKTKSAKPDKVPLSKAEGHKGRDKELLWLEKELHKIERETGRLEREKEKFLERAARLEKMRQAMGHGPAEKKEIYIKTSTGEFRFEGISQTFTKKLYEWEERRGIRPESSTIALLDPNYVVQEKEVLEKPKSPEVARLVKWKSESSVAADLIAASVHSHPSSLSLNEMDQDDSGLLEGKAASEPTLAGGEPGSPKVAVLVQLEEVVEDGHPALHHHHHHHHHHDHSESYAPAEITKNIDSSGSDDDATARRRAMVEEEGRSQGSYRSLLRENMSLLDRLRQQEDMCRALEHQMGDIDSKMDNVTDQHLRTLEKLHRQVSIIMKEPTTSHDADDEGGADDTQANDDPEANQRLIHQLRSRIADLELRGEHLIGEKVQLERAFKLHKEQETEIAESLVQRIRELQDAGAEVNIHTVQCQTDDLSLTPDDSVVVEDAPAVFPEVAEVAEAVEVVEAVEEVVEKVVEAPHHEPRPREHRKGKKAPPKKLQKLHNLTGDLLLQAKCLEQALVTKHGLDHRRDDTGQHQSRAPFPGHRQRSLRGRSSLRLAGDTGSHPRSHRSPSARTWSSIEAIAVPSEAVQQEAWTGGVGGGEGEGSKSGRGGGGGSASGSVDPQDLIAMNVELSRMAKELRLEMMQMWSYRESTSPESVSSETVGAESLDEIKCVEEQLVAEAKEVFQSIALLPRGSTPPSSPHPIRTPSTPPHPIRTPSTRSRRSPSSTSRRSPSSTSRKSPSLIGRRSMSSGSLNKQRVSSGHEDRTSRRPADDSKTGSATPVRRDSHRQRHRRKKENADEDDNEEEEEEEQEERGGGDKDVFLPAGATFSELLLRSQQEGESARVGGSWEGAPRRRSSDGLSTLTSGPSRSHSPSPSIASSAPDTEATSRLDEDEDISLAGTWRTTTTTRSDDHVLSSSFEWEEEGTEDRRRPRARWRAVMEEEEEEEAREKPKLKDNRRIFETEVTVGGARPRLRELRTRRISDTQVEYESFGQGNPDDECFANTFSKTVYDDEALIAGRLSRNPSVRRNPSRDPEEWRRSRTLPSRELDAPEQSQDVFVPTKRTIFTMQGGSRSSDHARATPTFVESQDEGEGEGGTRGQGTRESKSEEWREVREDSKDSSVTLCPDDAPQANGRKEDEGTTDKEEERNETTDVPSNDIQGEEEKKGEKEEERKEEKEEKGKEGKEEKIKQDGAHPKEVVDTETEAIASESLDVVSALPRPGRSAQSLTPSPHPYNSPISHILNPTVLSPPIESKRKVLEAAANEGVPTVRNIIQKFNQRITENQELLGSPFRAPPMSPPWHSPRSQRKILAGLAEASRPEDSDSSTGDIIATQSALPRPMIYCPPSGVLKSHSTSILMSNTVFPPQVTRSASGPFVQGSTIGLSSQQTPKSNVTTPDIWGGSVCTSPAISPTPTDLDTSTDFDLSTDDIPLDVSLQAPARSPSAKLRAMKIKKAKEDFLARGVTPLTPEQRHSDGQDVIKLRPRSGTASTEDSWRDSDELFAGRFSPPRSPSLTEVQPQEDDAPDRLPRTPSKRHNIPKKESFRRQSDGCLLEESASRTLASQVVKSASSGILSSDLKGQPLFPPDSPPIKVRKSSTDPSIDSSKSSHGIFRLFRRNRNRDKKDMSVVQRLCRQSLLVDFANGKGRTGSASPQLYSDPQLRSLPEGDEEMAGSSRTLPRASSGEVLVPAPSRSCPSSPVAQHRSRTANWIARGRHIFKSRSPSPSKRPR